MCSGTNIFPLVPPWMVKSASISQISEFHFGDGRFSSNKVNSGQLNLMEPFFSEDMIYWVLFVKYNYKMDNLIVFKDVQEREGVILVFCLINLGL